MIPMTRDTLAAYFITDLLNCPYADFIATLNAHDDAEHFAELDIIDARDANDMILLPFCDSDDDAALDAASAMLDSILDTDFDYIHTAITNAIKLRAERAF